MGHFQHLRGREVVLVVDKEGYRVSGFQQLREREVFLVLDDDDLVGDQFREMFDEVKRALARRDPYRELTGRQAVADALRCWALFEALKDDEEDDD